MLLPSSIVKGPSCIYARKLADNVERVKGKTMSEFRLQGISESVEASN